MNIHYIHHSGFIVENVLYAMLIDCCGLARSSVEVRAQASKSFFVLASHSHGDHFDPEVLSYNGKDRKYIFSSDIMGSVRRNKDLHFLEKGDVYRDGLVKIKAYGSTDIGVSFYIELNGYKIFHAGDLNNWHWNEDVTPAEAAENEKKYLDELALIADEVPALDAAMFPVDPRLGKDYTRGAEQFLDAVKVKLFVPMHFWDDYEAANTFAPEAEKRGCRFAAIGKEGDTFEI